MPTIRHAVYFWLRNPGSEEDRETLIAGLRGLAAIDEVQSLTIGLPAATMRRDVVDGSFDVSEMMTFASVADQDAYQTHELHNAFVEKHQHLWERVAVFDTHDLD